MQEGMNEMEPLYSSPYLNQKMSGLKLLQFIQIKTSPSRIC